MMEQKQTKSAIFCAQMVDFRGPGHILKLESSASSPVATSLEVSMPHQPATFPFPSVSFKLPFYSWFQRRALMELHRYIIYEVADTE